MYVCSLQWCKQDKNQTMRPRPRPEQPDQDQAFQDQDPDQNRSGVKPLPGECMSYKSVTNHSK